MFIISNNCLGGYIYRDILKKEYCSPFIWTLFDPNAFIDFINEFDTINLEHIKVYKENPTIQNSFKLLIDNKYKLDQIHMVFDEKYTEPTIVGANKCDVHYNKIWEYITENYIKRLNRARLEKEKIFIFYDNYGQCKDLNKLITVMKEHPNYNCIAFTNKTIDSLNNLIVKPISTKWNSEPSGWYNSFMKTYKDFLEEYLSKFE